MAVPFPYPGENMTGMMSLVTYANTLTEGFLGTGIMIFIAVVSLISTKSFSTEKSFAFTSLVCFILGLLFRYMNLISSQVFLIIVFAFIGSMIWLVMTRENEQV